jgi:hypothetical protein
MVNPSSDLTGPASKPTTAKAARSRLSAWMPGRAELSPALLIVSKLAELAGFSDFAEKTPL